MSFEEAVAFVSGSTAPSSNELKLQLYGLYKIATGAVLPTSRPSVFDFTGRAKYDAWKGLTATVTDEEQAKQAYKAQAQLMGWEKAERSGERDLEDAPSDLQRKPGGGMVNVSTMSAEEPPAEGSSSPLHDAAVDGDIDALVQLLVTNSQLVNERDSYGYTPLHLASDRGHIPIVKALLDAGADASLKDEDDQTAFMLATESGHSHIIALLS